MPVSSVSRSDSAFICANISTAPSPASMVMQPMRPSASKRGVKTPPSSSSVLPPGGGKAVMKVLSAPDKGEEPHLLRRIVAEDAGELIGDGRSALLHDAAHGHAQMLGFEHHRRAARTQMLFDGTDDLRGERFLRLQAAGVDI